MASYEINAPDVAAEILDGEAIILHLPKGNYFSAQGSGAFIWAGIERRMSTAAIAAQLADRFGIDAGRATEAVDTFIASLREHDLIRPSAAAAGSGAIGVDGFGTTFEPPRIEVYTDMQDILLLDPIHDVDSAGWPIAPDQAQA